MDRELGLEIRQLRERHRGRRYVEALAGDAAAAVERLREGYEGLGRLGETGFRSTMRNDARRGARRAGPGRGGGGRCCVECEGITQAEDFDPQARLRSTRARILARRGEHEAAERLAREAVAIMEPTDYIDEKALHPRSPSPRCSRRQGSARRAAEALREALTLFEQEGQHRLRRPHPKNGWRPRRRRARLSAAATVRPRWRGAGRSYWASRTARPSRRSGGRACSRACATRSRRAAARSPASSPPRPSIPATRRTGSGSRRR